MFANSCPQPLDLSDERVTIQARQIFVHTWAPQNDHSVRFAVLGFCHRRVQVNTGRSAPADEMGRIDAPVTCVSFMRVSIASRLSCDRRQEVRLMRKPLIIAGAL